MARALVLTHVESEGPGHLGTWLPGAGLDLVLVAPWNGDAVPATLEGFDALIVLGGPQQAYDDASAPWLAGTKSLLAQAVSAQLPTFAVCLGAQLLAVACGGTVAPGSEGPELGARLVAKRDVAGNDPLFWDLPLSPMVVQWHWDAVTALPPGSTLLMAGRKYENQAFRVGDRAWGIQFHVEADEAMVRTWVEDARADLDAAGVDVEALLGRTMEHLDEIEEVWSEVLRRFAALVG